jgi:predicted dehydrogenase
MNDSCMTSSQPERPGHRVIRWGILGTGNIASSFAEGLKALPDAELVGVGSRTQAGATAFAARFGVPKAYGTYRELAEAADVDVVYIATPNSRHKEDCLLCIDAGKAVLCEKPFAMNAADAQEIIDRARGRGVFFMEAMWMRFIPLVQKAREILRRGDIGKPCLLLADFGYPIERDPKNRFLNLELGGGSLLDRGIYPLSLAYFLFGEPVGIAGQAAIGPTGVDEQSSVLLKFAGGSQAVLTSTMNAFGTNLATIVGTHGQIELAAPFFKTERISVTKFPVPDSRAAAASPVPPTSPGSPLRRILRRGKRFAYRAMGRRADQVTYAVPLEGNGFNYEAAEVGRCLREGLLESPTMMGEESVRIIKAMDALRAQWGIVYPNDR